VPHVRICAGGTGQPVSLPRPRGKNARERPQSKLAATKTEALRRRLNDSPINV
jgi:hypothetical protein